MALAYLLSHVFGLQQRSPAPLAEPDTRTLVSYAFVTPSITISGPYVLVTMTPGNPLAAAVTTTAKPVTTPTTTARRPIATTSSTPDSDDSATDSSAQSTTDNADVSSPTMAAITTSVAPNTVAAAPSTPTTSFNPGLNQISATQAATSATASATEPQKGMSGGAVAGLIFGLLLGIGAVVGIVIFLYKRKKQEQGGHARLDDEKAFTSRPDALPQHPLASATQPERSMIQTPPTLHLNNFDSGAPIIPMVAGGAAAAAVGAAASSRGAPSPVSTTSAWERPGSSRFNDPENPFGNHAELSTTPPKSSLSINTAAAAAAAPAVSSAGRAPVELHTEPLTAPGPINAADFPLPQSMPASPASTIPKNAVPSALLAGGAGALAGAAVAGAASSTPKEEAKVYRVQMDFVPSMDDELAIRAGQLIKVQHEYDDGWALVGYMDGSKSGVVPRTCLSKNALKPRPQNGPASPSGRPGPGMRPGNGPPGPRAMTPQGRNSPAPFAQAPRPMTPTGRSASNPSGPPPAPFAQAPRPSSPASAGRARAQSNAADPYVAYAPAATDVTASPSFGAGQLKPTPRPDNLRRRSNTLGDVDVKKAGETEPPILMSPLGQMPSRKPVGAGMSTSPPAAPAPLS